MTKGAVRLPPFMVAGEVTRGKLIAVRTEHLIGEYGSRLARFLKQTSPAAASRPVRH
jgi:hypothetical protein